MTAPSPAVYARASAQIIGEEIERLQREHAGLGLVELAAQFMSLTVMAGRAGGCSRETLADEFAKSLDRHFGVAE